MPVHVTRRRCGVWYAAGSVRVGKETIIVAEYSTGCRARADAEATAAAEDQKRRAGLLEPSGTRATGITIADRLLEYLHRPGGVRGYDLSRIADLNERIGGRLVADAPEAWAEWVRTRGAGLAATSIIRWRTVLVAALGAGSPSIERPKTRPVERMVYLTDDETTRLLAAYSPAARVVATVLAYQGLRTQEALRLDWRCVDWRRRTIHVTGSEVRGEVKTKSRRPRTVPMHRRVRVTLYLIWRGKGRPQLGAVFLSSRGHPYQDTRGVGGNPLRSAHGTACRNAGISGFRIHDWRHSWAAHMVMSGCDLPTLMRLGGWSTLQMVQRYVSVSTEHMAEAIRRLA